MPLALVGSTWKKWDLHVHTPDSFYQNYPGSQEEAWEAFLADIEKLPAEFKVIGINDYVLVDGYEKVLKAKSEQGRLKNIDLVLPVVELRLDKFGGVVQGGKSGKGPSSWSRINVHVIFDQVEPELIRQQFISAIAPSYRLLPGSTGEGKWNSVISRQSIEALGAAIIETVPADKRAEFGSPLIEGFNNLNVSADGLRKALENDAIKGKFIVAVGKTEWENLKWDDHSIAEKKTLINDADLVFTAAESPEDYAKARAKLKASGVNANLLDCSDAHWLSASADKDRIGNCFTWIKADCTFKGLLQAIEEFEDRVYVGDNPAKRQHVELNRTKFIQSVKVTKKEGSKISDAWFDVELPLNPDLVAVIGNKGSGKSALADIIALAGNTKNYRSFSFLNEARFRDPRARLAQQFVGTLVWRDGSVTSQDLDRDPEPSSVERVKYLPQSYLETLCNELGAGGSATFDAELRKIIYSHVPLEDQLGQPSMDALLNFKVAEINKAMEALRGQIATLNIGILEAEGRLFPEFKKGLVEQLAARKAELASLDEAKPKQVEDPNASPEALEASKQAAAQIDSLEQQLQAVGKEEVGLREAKSTATKRQAVAYRIAQSLANQKKQCDAFEVELKQHLAELGVEIAINSLFDVRINAGPVEDVAKAMQGEINSIDAQLQSAEPGSILKRREELSASIAESKSKLGERQRLFVLYKEELAKWEKSKAEISGSVDRQGTIAWLESEIAALAALPDRLQVLKAQRAELSKEIHGLIRSMVNEFQRLYLPVQAFVQSAGKMDMNLPLEFHVRIEEAGFQDQFLGKLNRQVRGTFSGVDDGNQALRRMLQEASFALPEDALAFAERIDHAMHIDQREGQNGRETRVADQLRKGIGATEVLDYLFGLAYLSPRYSLTFGGQDIGQLSPGERGLLLLVFYLLVDKDDIPIVIDQPEENLDNQTIYKILVKCIKKAKERRQVIMVTHNPNLAVVCDAEQIVYASRNTEGARFEYEAGAIEQPEIKNRVVQILEGTEPAFKNRQSKYRLQ
ncbi:TrlF family AAA-like ATPase [Ralstonia solanacearum]|uniref:AAA family ATPase n=1 Tax=Ralstonia solanacearum TaxID=305 RepID=A0AAE3NPS6_RALSL|nr:AAA family ATPase [Ralstonia solanacearum]MBB6580934.1 AAA family ATPase [Ralstonia solanacearum]MDB0524301.1 AAA family ATPase [Ralstonia solanacearum]